MIEWKVNTMLEYYYPFISKVWLCKKVILSAVQHGGNFCGDLCGFDVT